MPPHSSILSVLLIGLAGMGSVMSVFGRAGADLSPENQADLDGPGMVTGSGDGGPAGGTEPVSSNEERGDGGSDRKETDSWLDRYHTAFKGQVDRSADWVDNLLGSNVTEDEPENTSGRVSGTVYWENREGFELGGRFRIKVSLDGTKNRFNAILGRGTPEELNEDVYSPTSRFASFYLGGRSDELVAGVAYAPEWNNRTGRFNLGGGLHLSSTPAPYVNANYNYLFRPEGKDYQVGFYQTVYYRTDEGFGSRTTIQPEWLIADDWLVQWYNVAEVGEVQLGVLWQSYLTLYQDLGRNRAIAYGFAAVGETDRDIPFINYGVSVTYRQQMFRDWLYGEVTVGVAFPREEPRYDRRGNPLIGLGLEFFFGD